MDNKFSGSKGDNNCDNSIFKFLPILISLMIAFDISHLLWQGKSYTLN